METRFTPKPNHFISVNDAEVLIKTGNKGTPCAAFATKKELREILNQEGCVGVRIYFNNASIGLNPIIVGVNAKGDELGRKILGWLPTSYPSLGTGLSSIVSPS